MSGDVLLKNAVGFKPSKQDLIGTPVHTTKNSEFPAPPVNSAAMNTAATRNRRNGFVGQPGAKSFVIHDSRVLQCDEGIYRSRNHSKIDAAVQ